MPEPKFALPAEAAAPPPKAAARANGGIVLIAIFDVLKAALFLVAAAGVFHLVDRNTHVELTRLLHVFRVNGDRSIVRSVLVKANLITDPQKKELTALLLLYAVLYAVEGIGLLFRQRWAEYFAVIVTAIPLPFEAHTLVHHATRSEVGHLVRGDQQVPLLFHSHVFVLKMVVLLSNVAIVCFLIYHLRRSAVRGRQQESTPII